ncbi:MAG: poly-gamma-glutamate hydrolase family protein [Desulfatitalea sp.]
MDQYTSFESLKVRERQGIDYRIRLRKGSSTVAILSIHGGEIEPGTTCLADAIAGGEHSFYSFEGIKSAGNLALHITSARFDEPTAIEMVCRSDIIISIHGSAVAEPVVHLGGLDVELRDRIQQALRNSGFQAMDCQERPFRATNHKNICNLCGRGMGVQMEISRGLRAMLFRDLSPEGRRSQTAMFSQFTEVVRSAIEPFAAIHSETELLQNTD